MRFKVNKLPCFSLTPEEIEASGMADKDYTFVEIPKTANSTGTRRILMDWYKRATPALLLSLDLTQYKKLLNDVRWRRHRDYMEAEFSPEDFDRVMAHLRYCQKERAELKRRQNATKPPKRPGRPARPTAPDMPLKQKAIYAPLYFHRGYNLGEIAEMLDVPEHIVKPWLSPERVEALLKTYRTKSITELNLRVTAEWESHLYMDESRRGKLDPKVASWIIKEALGRRAPGRPKPDDEEPPSTSKESRDTINETLKMYLGDEEEPKA